MGFQVIDEADIASLVIRPDTVVLVESRERAALGSGIEVWALRALPPFVLATNDAPVTVVHTYVVVVNDPDDASARDRVRTACHERVQALGQVT